MNATTHTPPAETAAAHASLSARLRIRSETAVVRLSAGVVSLHVADDNLLQPNPGTRAADHLVSGLVPIALVAGAAALVGGMRAGARGVTVLLLGFFGVLAGTEAVYYTQADHPSSDDYTGLLSLAAGLLLLVLGGRMLWQSRRRTDALWWRYGRRLLLTAAGFVTAYVLLFPIALAYFVSHVLRAGVPEAHLGAAHEDVSFTTSDGLRLEGWFVPSRNGATVVVFPGRSGPQKQTRMLVRHGYGVLLFDRRGEGTSEGDPNLFGWHGDRDLHAAAAYLRSRRDVDPARIGAIGLSVGGEMLIHAAAHSRAFKAVVSEGASGQSSRDGWANGDRLEPILGGGANTLATAVFTNTLPPISLKSEVASIAPTPVFFIYGQHGQGGTETGPNKGFYAAAREPKQIWEVPGGQHIAGITTKPAEYERRVIGFFDRALVEPQRRR